MSLKVLNSIILLGMSCRYVSDKENRDKEEEENKKKEQEEKKQEESYILKTGPSLPQGQHVISDPLDKDPQKQVKPTIARKVKTLNEIDRYTLCSNRIV